MSQAPVGAQAPHTSHEGGGGERGHDVCSFSRLREDWPGVVEAQHDGEHGRRNDCERLECVFHGGFLSPSVDVAVHRLAGQATMSRYGNTNIASKYYYIKIITKSQ